jgi:RNA polymerase sigma-70 factor (sigma-E family)
MADGSDTEYVAYVGGRIPVLRRVAYLLCGDEHEADDLVQETVTKLYARWPRIAGVENVDGYVHTMLVRAFLDEKRRGWWKVWLFGADPEPPTPVDGPSEDSTMLRAALAQVPPRQQAVLVLRFLCDRPVAEVASLLGCSEGTVKSQTSHGLNTLRKVLGPRLPAAENAGHAAAARLAAHTATSGGAR